MPKTPWYESDNPDRHAVGLGRIALVAFGLVVLIGVIWYAISVAVSDPKGQADAYKIQNDGQNRMQSEAEFAQRYESYQGYQQKIDTAQNELVDAQGREEDLGFYRENLSGATNMCINAAREYNALVGNPQKNRFRPAELPTRLDPVADCKPTAAAATLAPSAPAGEPETGAGVPSPEPAPSN